MNELEEIKKKYPEIAKMTVKDVVNTDEFSETFDKAVDIVRKEIRQYESKAKTVIQHPFKLLEHKNMFNCETFRAEYLKVIDKQSTLSAAQREVIVSIGLMAYSMAVELLMKRYDKNEQNSTNS